MASERPHVEIELQTPIQHGSEEIKVLRMRKPIARDIRKLPATPNTGDLLDLASILCSQPQSVIDRLEIEDATTVLEAVGDFFPGSRGTGA